MKIQVLRLPVTVISHLSSKIKFLTFGTGLTFKLPSNLSKSSCLKWTVGASFCNVQKLTFFQVWAFCCESKKKRGGSNRKPRII